MDNYQKRAEWLKDKHMFDFYTGKRRLTSKDFDGDIDKEYYNIEKIPQRNTALLTWIIVLLLGAFLVGICTGHINIILEPSL